MQVVPLFQQTGHALHLFRRPLVGRHLVLQPVALLGIAQFADQVIVVWVVVQAVEGRNVFESLHQHALLTQGVVVQRPMDLRHPLLPGPVFRRPEQEPGDFQVVDGVEPSETGAFLSVQLIVPRIDHAADSSDYLLAVEDHPHLPGAVLQG